MITAEQIKQKVARKYATFLKSWLENTSFFPLRIPAKMGNSRNSYSELQAWTAKLVHASKHQQGKGYTVIFAPVKNTRSHGLQTLPSGIQVDTQEDLLHLCGKKSEFQAFQKNIQLIQTRFPKLKPWILPNFKKVIHHLGKWEDLLLVLDYFTKHPQPKLYIRELPIAVDSKFVERHESIIGELLTLLLPPELVNPDGDTFAARFHLKEKPFMVRFRILDPDLLGPLGLPWPDMSLPLADFAKLPIDQLKALVVENSVNYLVVPHLKQGMVIMGAGFAVARLKVPWMERLPLQYWGDLDAPGLQILARFRANYPQVQSLMMDQATYEKYKALAVKGSKCKQQPPPKLNPQEAAVYLMLNAATHKLEQEKISHGWFLKYWEEIDW